MQNVEQAPNLYIAMTRAYISGSPEVAHARVALESSTRRWVDLALGDSEVGDRDAIVRILEDVLFANMVGLVTGGRAPGEIADELELAARTLLQATMSERRRTSPPAVHHEDPRLRGRDAAAGDGEAGRLRAHRDDRAERFPYYTTFPFAWYRACDTSRPRPRHGAADAPPRARPRPLARRAAARRTSWTRTARTSARTSRSAAGSKVATSCARTTGGSTTATAATCASRTATARTPRPGSVRIPTVDVNGFVMFWYHPDPQQAPLWEIPDLPEYATDAWTEPIVAEWNVRCPWQELAENGPDFVHLKTVHGAATVPEVESITYDGWCNHIRARVDFATPRGPQPGRIDTDSWGPGFRPRPLHRHHRHGVLRHDDTDRLGVDAVDQGLQGQEARHATRSRSSKTTRVGEALVRDLRKQMAEDNVIFDNKIHVASPRSPTGTVRSSRSASGPQFYAPGSANDVVIVTVAAQPRRRRSSALRPPFPTDRTRASLRVGYTSPWIRS